MEFRIISYDEVEDFNAAIRDCGRLPEDFELMETVLEAVGLERGIAIVESKKSGVKLSYQIGHDATFPADFALDLKNGVIG